MTRPARELDIENLVDFFEIKMHDDDGNVEAFALYPGSPPLDIPRLVNILASHTIYTFNGWNYDLPVMVLALYGATHQQLKEAGDAIIQGGLKPWDFYTRYGIAIPEYIDHVDLMEVAPGVRIGLKMYMGRMHAPTMQDLPVAFDVPVQPHERKVISDYCDNDLYGTRMLRDQLHDRLSLRAAISERYGVDVRSKSDAQIAEAVIKSQLGFRPERRYIPHGYTFRYEPPTYIRFVTPQMQELLQIVRDADFMVSSKEEAVALGIEENVKTGVLIPASLKGRDIQIGQAKYRLGIGGLHSQESCVCYASIPGVQILKDIDVKSYYPSNILSLEMYPEQLGPDFLRIYRTVYTRRLEAKSDAAKLDHLGFVADAKQAQVESDGLKIVLNGTFGKLFSKYSIFYAPELGIRVTMTGQLALLMLIEMMELSGIKVASANTDGIVLVVPVQREQLARDIVAWWEQTTGLEMEESIYRSINMRDVNNYVAITDKGKVKRKGVFVQGGLLSGTSGKGPDKDICADAVVAFLKDGTPIEQTIMACRDITKFLQIRQVTGGAVDLPAGLAISDGHYLGKAVRWYISGRPGYIGTKGVGNKVAGTDGATPIMKLPPAFPIDVQYSYYIDVARDMLKDIGVTQ